MNANAASPPPKPAAPAPESPVAPAGLPAATGPATQPQRPPAAAAFTDEEMEDELPFDETVIEWSGPEFIYNAKSFQWYAILLGGAAVLAILAYFISKDVMTAGSLIAIGALLAVMGGKKPRVTTFRLDGHGLTIGKKQYGFDQFRSFAPMVEHGVPSISFYPLQRFMPWVTIYHSPADTERIQDMLANHLPLEERAHDYIDQVLHKIKF